VVVDLSDRIAGQAAGTAPPMRATAAEDEPAALVDRVRALYQRVDAEIAARQPVCINRGTCCRFDAYGHRLYVTQVELDYFLLHQRPHGLRDVTTGACPYQIAGRCTAREHRPLGCRIFFCDPNAQDWQPALYERRLAELKQIGEELGIEYRYKEWLVALGRRGPCGDETC